jgi:hypothetical protein|tara:strand:+ start:204 stop:515 length:312 start_codon:yes stop_codon:yes gene_type:complete
MTNNSRIVPVYIDLVTGKHAINASELVSAGFWSYRFKIEYPRASWVIIHGRQSKSVILRIYDESGEDITKKDFVSITLTDESTITVDFDAPTVGIAHLMVWDS